MGLERKVDLIQALIRWHAVYSQPGDPVVYDDGIYYGVESGNMGLMNADDGAYVGLLLSNLLMIY